MVSYEIYDKIHKSYETKVRNIKIKLPSVTKEVKQNSGTLIKIK
jgi:hypothetical protein